jgi:WD40 repeat protein
VREIVISPDGKQIVSAGGDYAIAWDYHKGKEIFTLEHGDEIFDIDYSPDGKYLATASWDSTVCLWESASGKKLSQNKYEFRLINISFSADGEYLITACREDTNVYVYDLPGLEVSRSISLNKGPGDTHIRSFALSPDGRYLAIISGTESHYVSDNYFVRLWNMANGELIHTLTHEKKKKNDNPAIYALAFSHNSRYLATGSKDGTTRIWDLDSGEEKHRLRSSCGREVCFSPDDKWLLSACSAMTVWDYQNQNSEEIWIYGDISNIIFSPHGKHAASSNADYTVRVWNLDNNQEIIRIITGRDRLPLCFNPDGNILICCTGRETLGFYRLFPDDLVKEAGLRLSRNLTPEEWHTYFGDESYAKTFPELP